jgi:hypothetical protein
MFRFLKPLALRRLPLSVARQHGRCRGCGRIGKIEGAKRLIYQRDYEKWYQSEKTALKGVRLS